jgi:DNA-binding response OmpR family regulator
MVPMARCHGGAIQQTEVTWMPKERILVVEDDKNISRLIKYNMDKSGFQCIDAETGEKALEILDREHIDLVILDIMLPKMDGFEVCKLVKQHRKYSDIPIIILTAKSEEVDRVVGFELGADDYVVKPFSTRELALRAKAVLKRYSPKEDKKGIISAGSLKVDVPRHRVMVNGSEITLTLLEFKLLLTLMQRAGRVQSRDRLLSDVWEMAGDITTRTIDTHIKRLRQKLGDVGDMIETVRGIGYRFKEEA